MDEKFSIIHCLGPRAILVTKLRQVKPSCRKNELGVPHVRITIRVPRIQRRTLTCLSLRLRQKTDSNRPFVVRCTWQLTAAQRWPWLQWWYFRGRHSRPGVPEAQRRQQAAQCTAFWKVMGERFDQHAWTGLRTNGCAGTTKDPTPDSVLRSKEWTPKRRPRIPSF